jgi:predicted nucleotidyltransferase component of viral defense system
VASLIQILENALASKDPRLSNETKRIVLKEALQAFVLDFIYNHSYYRSLNFYGGTCLHVIYGLNRLSEDIDLDNGQGIELDTLPSDLLDYVHKHLGYQAVTVGQKESREGILRLTLRFPVLYELGLSAQSDERLHLKLEISHHRQLAVIKNTPVIFYGRSFVPAHFSLETMMAGKMLACLERSFQVGGSGVFVKGRDYYDLLWFMQQNVQPFEGKLEQDGNHPYNVKSAMMALQEKTDKIRTQDLAVDLLPLFEQRTFIEAWIDSFHENFQAYVKNYL